MIVIYEQYYLQKTSVYLFKAIVLGYWTISNIFTETECHWVDDVWLSDAVVYIFCCFM